MLKRQIPFSPPDISDLEIQEVCDALRSGWITTGPRTKQFEKNLESLLGGGRVVCLNSATAALELALYALGIGPGDEVIVPAYTYTATASVVHHVGAKIVFCDVAKDSFEMDYDQLESLLTERTKAVIPVDLGGRICDYSRILTILERHRDLYRPRTPWQEAFDRIICIADCAHAVGARQKASDGQWYYAGTQADFSSFSFHAVKNLSTAEGGALTWRPRKGIDDEAFYKEIQLLSLHGQNKDALAKTKAGAWEYDIIYPAYKCNMTDVLASIGLKQLERYPSLLAKRKEAVRVYDAYMQANGLDYLCHEDEYNQTSMHLYLVRIPDFSVEERNRLIELMGEGGVACNVHYKPLPMMTAYKRMGFDIENFPNSYAQYANCLSLPLHSKLEPEDVDYVLYRFDQCLQQIRAERQ